MTNGPRNLTVPSLNLSGILQQFDVGRERARQQRAQSALSEFGAQAFGGDQQALTQLFRDNPQAAISLGQILETRQGRQQAARIAAEDRAFRRERAQRADELAERQFQFEKTKFQQKFELDQNELLFKINKLNQESRPDIKDINATRKEFIKVSGEYIKARDAFIRVRSAGTAQNPTGADDLALIFNFMKVLDPGSTVRRHRTQQ